MKKAIVLSSLILALLISAVVFSQSSPETLSRIRDKTTSTTQANVSVMGATQPATNTGLNTASGCYYYGGVTWDRWTGEVWDTAIDGTTAPSTISLNAFYDTVTAKGYRWYGEPLDAVISSTAPVAPFVGAYGLYWDATTSTVKRWAGEHWDVSINADQTAPAVMALTTFNGGAVNQAWLGEIYDTVMDTQSGYSNPNVNAYNVFYDTVTTKTRRYDGETIDDSMDADPSAPFTAAYGVYHSLDADIGRRVTGEAYDDAMTVAPTNLNTNAFSVFWDGAANRRWTGSTLPTSLSPPAAPYTGAMSYGYEPVGAKFRPLKVDTSGDLYVQQASLLPGEDATNDWRKVKTQAVATFSPTATNQTAVDATGTIIILAATEILAYSNYVINVKNTGGVNSLANVIVETAPDSATWSSLVNYATAITPGGNARVVTVAGNAERYVRVRAASAAATTTTTTWITGRVAN